MKKLLAVIGLILVSAVMATAQSHRTINLLAGGINAVVVTNTLQITNFNYRASVRTNVANTTYTNDGTRVVVTAAGVGSTTPLLISKVDLWADREGRAYAQTTTNVTDSTIYNTPCKIIARYNSGSGANAAVTLGVSPVYNDNVGELAGSQVTALTFTAVASQTDYVVEIPVPMYKFAGAKALRLCYISNADTDASSQVTFTHLSLNGFIP